MQEVKIIHNSIKRTSAVSNFAFFLHSKNLYTAPKMIFQNISKELKKLFIAQSKELTWSLD